MTSVNNYTVQIGGNYAFSKSKYLEIEIQPQKININYNILYLTTYPNESTVNELTVTTDAAFVSSGSNYKKYAVGDNEFTIEGLPESVSSVNLYMDGSDTDDIGISGWYPVSVKNDISVVDGSVKFNYKYKYGF